MDFIIKVRGSVKSKEAIMQHFAHAEQIKEISNSTIFFYKTYADAKEDLRLAFWSLTDNLKDFSDIRYIQHCDVIIYDGATAQLNCLKPQPV